MLAMPGLRSFSVSAEREPGRVSCSTMGLFVGNVPLLERQGATGGYGPWTVRPSAELNNELTACYRLPVDIASKANALALIAHAFNRGDRAMAAIAAVQMQFPNPPPVAKAVESANDVARRAVELHRSGLLKDWDPGKHPRTGTPPNPGWFAPVSHSEDQGVQVAVRPDPHNPWKISPDSEGGGGGAGEATPRPGSQAELPFPGGLPPQLAPYVPGGKTSGIFETPTGAPISLQSGYDGPAADMPPESEGFNSYTLSHVEGHAAALMRQEGITEGTLYINNPNICRWCMKLLPTMLPSGSSLNVVLPNGTVMQFKGIGP